MAEIKLPLHDQTAIMKNTFTINYNNSEVTVEQHLADKYNNNFFTAHLPEGDIQIECTEDNDGASRWLDKNANHQTDLSNEIGHLIALYETQNKISR